jgi:hypothetical protein
MSSLGTVKRSALIGYQHPVERLYSPCHVENRQHGVTQITYPWRLGGIAWPQKSVCRDFQKLVQKGYEIRWLLGDEGVSGAA